MDRDGDQCLHVTLLKAEQEEARRKELAEQTAMQAEETDAADDDGEAANGRQRSGTPAMQTSRRRVLLSIPVVVVLLVCVTPAYFWLRNNTLRDRLRSCDAYGVVFADAYYDGIVSTDTVVFDLKAESSYSARRIDPVHLFLQFAGKLDLYSVRRVVLASRGDRVFYIWSSDLRPLSDSYAGDGRLWAFNNLPSQVQTMYGERAFEEWTGGWLGVLKEQQIARDPGRERGRRRFLSVNPTTHGDTNMALGSVH